MPPPRRAKSAGPQDADAGVEPAPKAVVTANLDALNGKAVRYVILRDKLKELKKEQDGLSSELKSAAQEYGTKEKESFTLDTGDFIVAKQAKISRKIDQTKAMKVLDKVKLLERCTMRIVDSDAIAAAFQEGLISAADISSFISDDISYAISVEPKDGSK
jgi:hypothetical protein